jgi:hypothetical protein
MPSMVELPEITNAIDKSAFRTPAAGVATAPTTNLPLAFIRSKNPHDLSSLACFYARTFTTEKISASILKIPNLKSFFLFFAF